MYALEIRNHIMIAHSLPGEFFGQAQGMHGATFIVDVTFFRERLDEHNVVVDIGHASKVLAAMLKPIDYANLDILPVFAEKITTTEFLCRHIFDGIEAAIRAGELGEGGRGVERVRVTLSESHVARAWFEGAISA
jgi:6-pyruvoyl-tetrahydropterin synthase